MQTLSDQEKEERKATYAREYAQKHNYMDCPGDTSMPEYSSEEIEDIESGMLLKDVAKKHGRSFKGVSDKKYRMKHGKQRYASAKQRKENYDRMLKNKPLVLSKKVEVKEEDCEAVLSGEMSIQDFLNS